MPEKPKERKTTASANMSNDALLSIAGPCLLSQMLFVTKLPTPDLETWKKTPSKSWAIYLMKFTKKCSIAFPSEGLLPDSEDDEVPWHDEQQEEYK